MLWWWMVQPFTATEFMFLFFSTLANLQLCRTCLVWKAEMINYVKTSKDKPNDALLQTYTFFDMLGGSALAPQLTQSWNDKPM